MSKDHIIICLCTSGERKSLKYCMDSLQLQKIGNFTLSINLIDNSFSESAKFLIKKKRQYPVNYINEKKPGIPIARNTALRHSKDSKWIAFIDDDEIAPDQWINSLYNIAVNNNADVVAGNVVYVNSIEKAKRISKTKIEAKANNPIITTPANMITTIATSNVLFKNKWTKPPYNIIFDENMVFGGSDSDFFQRLYLAGGKILSTKSITVFEHYPPKRRTFSFLLKRWFRYGYSLNYRYSKNYHIIENLPIITTTFFYRIFRGLARLVLLPLGLILGKKSRLCNHRAPFAEISFALGIVANFFGVKLNKYY